jgi:hypothetical protein
MAMCQRRLGVGNSVSAPLRWGFASRLTGALVVALAVVGSDARAESGDEVAASSAGAAAAASSTASKANDFGLAAVRLINDQTAQAWKEHKLVPSEAASDGEWCRRVYLDVIGRVPTVDELKKYLANKQHDKRKQLVDRLLGDEYRDEYVRNWTTFWTNLLIGRTGGKDRKSLADRPGMEQWVAEELKYNKPYDEFARQLITATGSCRPGDKDFNGAANFLADKMADNGLQATAKTSQVFLGMAVQCTQCHNHPFNEYQQNQFWELNAFFRQTHVEKLPEEDKKQRNVGRVVDRDFKGEGGDPKKAEIYYEQRNGKLKVAYPVFVDGTSLAAIYASKGEDFGEHGLLADVNRREDLAKLVMKSREFDRAIVNRLWGHFLGYGFTKPVDDIGPHNAPSHPELLDGVGQSFREAGFDVKQLMRWIVLSEPYELSSRMTKRNEADDPALGARPMFSHFYLRQMEAEQLYESLLVATAAEETAGKDEDREVLKQRWLDQLNTAFGTDDNAESSAFNGTIPQALVMMNGPLVNHATGNKPGSMLAKVAGDETMNNGDKIRYLYLAAFSRQPTKQEINISNELLAERKGNVGAALQDIWWALLNSNEFILNH